MTSGWVVLLNGAPRAGKSSIVSGLQSSGEEHWMNLGVDVVIKHMTPDQQKPGIGLRPGGERPDLEDFVFRSYSALYKSIAAHAALGMNVVADLGHHNSYAMLDGHWGHYLKELEGLSVLIVGVFCPLDEIMRRRAVSEGDYLTATTQGDIPLPVQHWQDEVHEPGIYDLELDTSILSPEQCAAEILRTIASGSRFEARDKLIALLD
ncbi:Chloramphenicol phosphotransferase family protein [Pseudovibrio sp. FO-BEG1]|uniref:chloramphenicol phosphotransferase CPT family protein n=1 Tax=Pseudovibrio sp. (strain FO-BEG1) TaxID=911045 RepID=UPI000238C586|nr:phosphotransferase [Pseudovibrio sp. FO-BEG1]AEV36688.1 Chloramphenicol phosphotransferase family protein [Pseudovibrio sp. FO-BEG1]